VGAGHAGHFFHRFQTAPNRPIAPVVEESAGPDRGLVMPIIAEGLFQTPGPCGGQLAGEQSIELLPGTSPYPTATAQPGPAHVFESLGGGFTFRA
jgi:hypothetical protein